MSKTYRIFISHSVPKDDPIHDAGTDAELYRRIENQMSGCHGILILAGVYATYSKWINKQIDIANAKLKPIVAIEPWASERTSKVVKDNADRVVAWSGKSIANAVRDLF